MQIIKKKKQIKNVNRTIFFQINDLLPSVRTINTFI